VIDDARTILFVGGARSGKSRLAQARAEAIADRTGGELVFIATAQLFDEEMRERIARHQSDRDERWRTIESPIDLPAAILREGGVGRILLIDCLTLWMSNLILSEADTDGAGEALVGSIAAAAARIMLVTNEVGMGIVPDNALARHFRDEAGRLNQRVAAAVEEAQLVAAGLSLRIK